MIHAALLRGINVGGKNKVEMARLRDVFQRAGLTEVRTYINSGNVIFAGSRKGAARLMSELEAAIEEEFGFPVRVLVKTLDEMVVIAEAIPADWVTDRVMRCDVIFLWDGFDRAEHIAELPVREEIDRVIYVDGAVIWAVERANATKSGLSRFVGTDMYRWSTIRNSNTTRTLVELMRQAG